MREGGREEYKKRSFLHSERKKEVISWRATRRAAVYYGLIEDP